MLTKIYLLLVIIFVGQFQCIKLQTQTSFECDPVIYKTNISEACFQQMEILCRHPELLYMLWDASSRYLHTGISTSSNIDYGDFDLCLSIDYEENGQKILGKYCYAVLSVDFPIIQDDNASLADGARHENKVILPKVVLRNLALSLCIPDQCTAEEMIDMFRLKGTESINKHNECITKETDQDFTVGTYVVLCVLGVIIALMIISTVYDVVLHYTGEVPKEGISKIFSVFQNGKQLLKINTDKVKQVQCLDGLRFLCISAVIATHQTDLFMGQNSLINANDIPKFNTDFKSTYMVLSTYAVDTFFFISGFVLALNYVNDSNTVSWKQQVKNIPILYLRRCLRIMPAAAALFCVEIWIFPKFPPGPKSHGWIRKSVSRCKSHWWRYFLFIQNYFPAYEMCILPTWYLSADMQMYLLSPLILIPVSVFLKDRSKTLITFLFGLSLLTTVVTMATDYVKPFNVFAGFYTHARLADFIIGIVGGLLLHIFKSREVNLNKVVNFILWILSLVILFIIAWTNNTDGMNPTHFEASILWVLYRPIWCICMLWIVFSCYFGYGGFINWILCTPFLQVGSRLSYSMYIVHWSVLIYYNAHIRTILYFDMYTSYYMWCGHMVTTMMVATFWTLAFEIPMIHIAKILLGGANCFKRKSKYDFSSSQKGKRNCT